MNNSWLKSINKSRLNSPAGSAMVVNEVLCDIQMVAAKLKRCGLAGIESPTATNPAYPGGITFSGPLGTNLAADVGFDLFTTCVFTMAWSEGSTAIATTNYAIDYDDMSWTTTYTWTTSTSATNIAAALPSGVDETVFPPSAPTNYTYIRDATNQVPTLTTTSSGGKIIKAVWTWAAWFDGVATTHYGGTLTVELTNPKTWGDFKTSCDSILAGAALLDSTTVYSGNFTAVTGATTFTLDWCSSIPNAGASAPYKTNNILVTRARSGFVYNGQIQNDAYFTFLISWDFRIIAAGGYYNANNPQTGGLTDGILQMLPLAMSAMPLCAATHSYTLLSVGVASDCGSAIYSVKSSMQSNRNHEILLSNYSSTGNSLTVTQSVGALAATYGPSDITSTDGGYIIADFNLPAKIQPAYILVSSGSDFFYIAGGTIARAASIALYALGVDKYGLICGIQTNAVWQSTLVSGSAGTLVDNGDGTATYTAPAGAAGVTQLFATAPGTSAQIVAYTTT